MKLSSLMEEHWRVITYPLRYSPVERTSAFNRFSRAREEFISQINQAGKDKGAIRFLNELYMGLYHINAFIPRNLDQIPAHQN